MKYRDSPSCYAKRSKSDVNRWRWGASVRVIRTISRVRVTADKSRSSFWQLLPSFIEAIYNAEKRKRAISLSVRRDTFPPEGLYRYVLRANETEGAGGRGDRQRDISLDKRAVSPRPLLLRQHSLATCARHHPFHPLPVKKETIARTNFPLAAHGR